MKNNMSVLCIAQKDTHSIIIPAEVDCWHVYCTVHLVSQSWNHNEIRITTMDIFFLLWISHMCYPSSIAIEFGIKPIADRMWHDQPVFLAGIMSNDLKPPFISCCSCRAFLGSISDLLCLRATVQNESTAQKEPNDIGPIGVVSGAHDEHTCALPVGWRGQLRRERRVKPRGRFSSPQKTHIASRPRRHMPLSPV